MTKTYLLLTVSVVEFISSLGNNLENNASPISNVSCWSSEGSLIIETSAMEVTDSKASLVEEPSLEEMQRMALWLMCIMQKRVYLEESVLIDCEMWVENCLNFILGRTKRTKIVDRETERVVLLEYENLFRWIKKEKI